MTIRSKRDIYLELGKAFTVVRAKITLKFVCLTRMTVNMVLKILEKNDTKTKISKLEPSFPSRNSVTE